MPPATLRPPSPAALPLLALTVLGLPAAACSYSWEVGSGGAAPTTSSAGGAGGGTGGASGTTTTPPDCDALQKAIDKARVAAQACSYAGAHLQGECAKKVMDACGCAAFVKDGGASKTKAFSDAVQAYGAAGCTPTCAACSALQTGACLQAGAVIHCVP